MNWVLDFLAFSSKAEVRHSGPLESRYTTECLVVWLSQHLLKLTSQLPYLVGNRLVQPRRVSVAHTSTLSVCSTSSLFRERSSSGGPPIYWSKSARIWVP